MLRKAQLWAIVPAKNLERAKKFYTEMIGLSVINDDVARTLLFGCADGTGLVVYEKPDMKPSDNTVAGWNVKDLEAEMADLRRRGLAFEEYNMPGMKTVNGIAELGGVKSAWLKDPDGNIFAINQM